VEEGAEAFSPRAEKPFQRKTVKRENKQRRTLGNSGSDFELQSPWCR